MAYPLSVKQYAKQKKAFLLKNSRLWMKIKF
jgi:hypothetical protein